MPRQKEAIYETANFYRSIGFILGRIQTLVAFVPWKARDDFNDKFYDAIGRMPYHNEQGLVIHPERVNKYWTECRIIFKATQRETLNLFLGYNWIVQGADTTHWNINNNALFFRLLALGFDLGNTQNIDTIKAKIPTQFLLSFNEGITNAAKK